MKFSDIYVGGEGPSNSEIMFFGECPGRHEENHGYPFAGPTGTYLEDSLNKAGVKRQEVYLSNISKRRIFRNEREVINIDELKEEINVVWEEVEAINPKVIVPLGALALRILTGNVGIRNWRGSILRHPKTRALIVPTYNPAHLLYQTEGGEVQAYWQKYLIDFDIARAVNLIGRYNTWRPPDRDLRIVRSSYDLYSFFSRYEHRDLCFSDIETIKTIPACISFSFNGREAVSCPLFQVLDGIQITTIPRNDLVECWRIIDKVLRTINIAGQNFKFDQERLESIGFRVLKFFADTMLIAHTIDPELPRSQAFLASIHTEEPYYKDEGKGFDPRRDRIDRFLLYNAKDSAVDYDIYQDQLRNLKEDGLYDFYFGYVNHLHNLYLDIERRGINVDNDKKEELIEKYRNLIETNNAGLEKIVGHDVNVNSPKQIMLILKEFGFPPRADTSEETLISLLGNHAKTPIKKHLIQGILTGRRLGKSRMYVEAQLDLDGRMRTSFIITGTETGRSATRILKSPMRLYKTGLALHTITKHGEAGKDVRSYLIPDPEMIFLNVDLSQAEARIVALLANDEDTLRAFDEVDIHRLTATWIYGGEMNSITDDQRFIGKTGRHGCNYDMKKHRLMVEVNTLSEKLGINLQISEWRADQILKILHGKMPNIRDVFHPAIKECINSTRTLINPYGRKRKFYERLGDDLYREAYAQIPQSTVGDKTKQSALTCSREVPEFQILLESHDALFGQVRENEWKEVAKRVVSIMSNPIDFSSCSIPRRMLVIPADVEVGENWRDMKKVKKDELC